MKTKIPNYYSPENNLKVSRILKLEYEITKAVMDGHKPHLGDGFKEKRKELKQLRKELFDENNTD